jgi:hypothetical protein
MTRCVACNKNLNDFESTRKNADTGEYLDLCNSCFQDVATDMYVIERSDLEATELEEWDEERLDIIGSNGNEGLHYDN